MMCGGLLNGKGSEQGDSGVVLVVVAQVVGVQLLVPGQSQSSALLVVVLVGGSGGGEGVAVEGGGEKDVSWLYPKRRRRQKRSRMSTALELNLNRRNNTKIINGMNEDTNRTEKRM